MTRGKFPGKAGEGSGVGRHARPQRGRTLSHWNDAISYDRVKRVINVYLNDFQLKDRDLERFIEWFESADGGRRTLAWLLERHHEEERPGAMDGEKDRTAGETEDGATASRCAGAAKAKPPGMNWHLQENQITDGGLKSLVACAARIQGKVELRRFYLYKNIIGSSSLSLLSALCSLVLWLQRTQPRWRSYK